MKFLFICDYLHPAYGYQEFHLAKELVKNKCVDEVTIITANRYFPFKNFNSHKKVLGERIHNKKFEILGDVKIHYYKPLLEKFQRVVPDLRIFRKIFSKNTEFCFSHSSTSFISIILIILSRFIKFKIMVDNHMHYCAKENTKISKAFYSIIKLINNFIASPKVIYFGVTSESCDFLHKVEGVPKERIKLLPIGYVNNLFYVPEDFIEFKTKYKNIRRQLKIADNEILLIQSGKLSEDKKPHLTIEASSYLLKYKKGNILFIGPHSKKERDFLREIFSKKSKKCWKLIFLNNVSFDKLNKYFITADLLSFPGGASLSCIEGAASGCKSIVAYNKEGLKRSKQGFTFLPEDNSDVSFKKLMHKKIKELDIKKVNQVENFRLSKETEALVRNMSYRSVSKILLEYCN